MSGDAIQDLQAFLDERWAVVQTTQRFHEATDGWRLTPVGKVCPLAEAITAGEAVYFLASVGGSDRPLFVVQDDNKVRSDRYPVVASGDPRGYTFFERSGSSMGGLRLETIVHWSAMARLRDEFRWPREHLVCESPRLVDQDGRQVLHQDALDILLLEEPCSAPAATMPVVAVRSWAGIEAKATAKMLEDLLDGMRACQTVGAVHAPEDHAKCSVSSAV